MHRLLASWFGTGLILRQLRGSDSGSGTVSAAFALVLALVLGRVGWQAQLAATILVILLSLWSSRPFAQQDDPGWVTVDEAAGTLLATIGLSGIAVAVAFVIFRLADIFKQVPGVGAAERLPGEWGVTADDLVAGLYGLAVGWLVIWVS